MVLGGERLSPQPCPCTGTCGWRRRTRCEVGEEGHGWCWAPGGCPWEYPRTSLEEKPSHHGLWLAKGSGGSCSDDELGLSREIKSLHG